MSRLTAEDKRIVSRMAEIRTLLGEFGATLSGYDPGVSAFLANNVRGEGWMGESLSFDGIEWGWLEPLLKELLVFRKGANKKERAKK